jgi:phosphoribosylanthranilate isomerase
MTFVKFCGMTRDEDVALACDLGVDAIGFVLWPESPRAVAIERVSSLVKLLPPNVMPVGVLVWPTAAEIRAALDAGVRIVQIHGLEPRNLGAVELRNSGTSESRSPTVWFAASTDVDVTAVPDGVLLLLDARDPKRHGGTGRVIDWTRAGAIARQRPILLAGGLTPRNVAEAIGQVRPYGVDVASGIEDRPGVKNAQAMRAFVAAVREAER